MSFKEDLATLFGVGNYRERPPAPLPQPKRGRQRQDHRPTDLRKMIGQGDARLQILSAITGARARRKVPEHFLLEGPPGLGKTSLAELVAAETGGVLISVSGSQIATPQALVQLVGRLSKTRVDTLFIDEVHELPSKVETCLYFLLEDLRMPVAMGRGEGATVEEVEAPPFICVAATTLPGALSQPFRNRFKTNIELEFYDQPDLTEIIFDFLAKDGGLIEVDAAENLASRSRGTPRIAQGLATAAWDSAIAFRGEDEKHITQEDVDRALTLKKIDNFGMGVKDRKILMEHARRKGRPMGPKSAAQATGLTEEEVLSVIEPFLIHRGFIRLTERGRRITLLGFTALGIEAPPGFNDEAILSDGWVDT